MTELQKLVSLVLSILNGDVKLYHEFANSDDPSGLLWLYVTHGDYRFTELVEIHSEHVIGELRGYIDWSLIINQKRELPIAYQAQICLDALLKALPEPVEAIEEFLDSLAVKVESVSMMMDRFTFEDGTSLIW